MKKILCIIMAALIVLPELVFSAFALPLSSGPRKLNNQFEDGRYGSYDYVYFSPMDGKDDAVKYPLIIWLHGKGSGKFARA